MNKNSIKSHLCRYSIFKKRATTINHAFASAIAPIDKYDENLTGEILLELECVVENEIKCIYCGDKNAQTWDHLNALVKNNNPSGYGHTYGNLVPSCKDCNSIKGNKSWRIANETINAANPKQMEKVIRVIESHTAKYGKKMVTENLVYSELDQIKTEIFALMKKADYVVEMYLQRESK